MVLRLRTEVRTEETWDLSGLFAKEEDFDSAMDTLAASLVEMEKAVQKPIDSASALLELLQRQDEMVVQSNVVSRYATLQLAEDATNESSQARAGRVANLGNTAAKVMTELRTKIVGLSDEMVSLWTESQDALRAYVPFLREVTHNKAHRLSDDVEAALAQFSSAFNVPSELYASAMGGDISFSSVADGEGREVAVTPFYLMTAIESSPDTVLRHASHHALTDGLRPHQHTLAKALGSQIQRHVTESKMRGYPTVLHMLQSGGGGGSTPNGVDPEHFFMVQDTLRRELAPHMRRYMALRKRVLHLDTALLADVKATLSPLDPVPVTFDKAKEIILGAGRLLGETYADIIERAFDERWIYRARNQGNWNGAFCGDAEPHPYVFSPFGERLYDTFILGHELGHAVHLHLTYSHQLPSNRAFSNLFIETPSTLMEHMMARYLRETDSSTDTMRRVNMVQLLTFHHNFVTHQTEAEILRRLYALADARKPLSTGVFRTISREVLQEFWGDTIQLDEGADLYWMRQPHYYMGIYSYTYSVGLAASTVLAKRVATEGEALMKSWIEVLKKGANRTALELFAEVGLDMASPEPYREAVRYVGELIDQLEKSYA